MVEDVRALGATAVALPLLAAGADARTYLPTPAAPLAADLFGRVARQLSTRAGVEVLGALDARDVAALGEARAATLLADAARAAPIDGLLLPAAAAGEAAVPPPATPPSRADIRASRAAAADPAVRLFRAAEAIDPRLRLWVAGPAPPGPAVDRVVLVGAAAGLAAPGWRSPLHSGRVVETLAGSAPQEARRAMRLRQRAGATALALCPWDPATTARLAPTFSGATVPWRP